jgi:hypothetical protein
MLKAFRTSINKTLEFDGWLDKNRSTVSEITRMQADDGSVVYILKFAGVFQPASIPGFGDYVKPVPLPNFNIEIKNFDELMDITHGRYDETIGAEYIRDFLFEIARSGRPAIVRTSADGSRYLMILDKVDKQKLSYVQLN